MISNGTYTSPMPQCKPEQLELAPHAAEHVSPPSEMDTNIYHNEPFQQHRAALEPCLRMCKKCKIQVLILQKNL